ncbi:hypothetical protein ACHAWF_009626 [Thalassiosira exigua]
MEGDAFINSVSGIVNRGCHDPPCPPNGELDGGPERAANFYDVLEEMKFSFVEVQPTPKPTPELVVPPPTLPPTPAPTHRPTPPPSPTSPKAVETPGLVPNPNPLPTSPPFTLNPTPRPKLVQYTCGDGYEPDPSDTRIPPSSGVTFDYDVHNEIDVTVDDALVDVKQSILADIASFMGCYKTYSGRGLQDSLGSFESITALQSSVMDLPDPEEAGCSVAVQVEADSPTTCTPVVGEFTIYALPGTSESSLQKITDSLKAIIEESMGTGRYETELVAKAVYIGDRISEAQPPQIIVQSDGPSGPNQAMMIAIYSLALACLVLLCLLWFTCRRYRNKVRKEKRQRDEESLFGEYYADRQQNAMMPQGADNRYQPQTLRRTLPNQTVRYENDEYQENQSRPRSVSRDSCVARGGAPRAQNGIAAVAAPESSSDSSVEDPIPHKLQRRQAMRAQAQSTRQVPRSQPAREVPRSQSAPRSRSQSLSRQRAPLPQREASSEAGSISGSSESSFEGDDFHNNGHEMPSAPRQMNQPNRHSRRTLSNENDPTGYNKSREPGPGTDSLREERQKRMAAARARAAKRRLA